MRTSVTHPLQIAEVRPAPGNGLIGVTLCPGKTQMNAITGRWNRDLGLDLEFIDRVRAELAALGDNPES